MPDTAVDQAIDDVLGDHRVFHRTFRQLRQALAADQRAQVAALVAYPLNMNGRFQVKNAAEFVANWDAIMTPEIIKVIKTQRYADLFVNADGIMLGHGEVWIGGICDDEKCSHTKARIITIQPVT